MTSQSPSIIWWNGRLVPWAEAQVHVTSDTAMRGTNVFEGVRAYWRANARDHAIVALEEHLDRLRRSAQALCLPADGIIENVRRGAEDLIVALEWRAHIYLRPTIYLESGGYSARADELRVGAFISCRATEPRTGNPISCAVSSWEHISDAAVPPFAKIGATYTAFRLSRLEASAKGADEAILLNARGHVTETPGAAIFLVRDNQVYTPPISDGILEGITRRIVIDLLRNWLSYAVMEQSISRRELYDADEVFICGTLDEIRAVRAIDEHIMPVAPGVVTSQVRELYINICEVGNERKTVTWLHRVPAERARGAFTGETDVE
jgi:branched-chain amino acid aminotransferase